MSGSPLVYGNAGISLLLLMVVLASCGPPNLRQGYGSDRDTRYVADRLKVTPTVLYPGDNVLKVRADSGVASVLVEVSSMKHIKVEGIDSITPCTKEFELRVHVDAWQGPVELHMSGEACSGGSFMKIVLFLENEWRLDRVEFPEISVGDTACRLFRVAPGSFTEIDSITFPPDLPITIKFEEKKEKLFPITLGMGQTLHYEVCFRGETPGTYVFPVTAWMRRSQPAGGYTNYPVADTGVVQVRQ